MRPYERETTEPFSFGVRSHHWAIRLRRRLLIRGSWKWNRWVRDATAWVEQLCSRREDGVVS